MARRSKRKDKAANLIKIPSRQRASRFLRLLLRMIIQGQRSKIAAGYARRLLSGQYLRKLISSKLRAQCVSSANSSCKESSSNALSCKAEPRASDLLEVFPDNMLACCEKEGWQTSRLLSSDYQLVLESTPSLARRLAHGYAMFPKCFKFRPFTYQFLEPAIEFPLCSGLAGNQNGEIAEIGRAVLLHTPSDRHSDKVGQRDE